MNRKGEYSEAKFLELTDIEKRAYNSALLSSSVSHCKRAHVGASAVIDGVEIFLGSNGIGCNPHEICSHEGMAKGTNLPCKGTHAEIDLISKLGIRIPEFICITHFPCTDCSSNIVLKGIERLLFIEDYGNNSSKDYLLYSGVSITKILID